MALRGLTPGDWGQRTGPPCGDIDAFPFDKATPDGGLQEGTCLMKMMLAAIGAVSLGLGATAMAQESPMDPGQYWEVTGVQVDDGHALDYTNFLASRWRANQEYAKSKGWVTGYHVLANPYKRAGEPDLYLVVMYNNLPDAAEDKKRDEAMRAFQKKSEAELQAESGGRAKFRKISESVLLREMTFAK